MKRHRCPACLTAVRLEPNDFPFACCGVRHETPDTLLAADRPGLAQRAKNLTASVAKGIREGSRQLNEAEIATRMEVCQSCPLFDGEVCTHPACGCNVTRKRKFLNKLAWSHEACPLAKWGKIEAHRVVLFLCSGNYYRSRYAEAMFNHEAARRNLAWRATSRALNPRAESGPIAREAAEALASLGIKFENRKSAQAIAADFEQAACIVAVKEREHRPLMEARFPGHLSRVEFWSIDDMDCCGPEIALPLLHAQVENLLEKLRAV